MGRNGRVLAAVLIGALFLGGLVWATLGEAQVECEVCLDYGRDSACRTSSGADRNAAVRGAVAAACAVLSDGVTSGMACDRTPPRKITCR